MAGPVLPRSARSPLAEVRRVQKARAKIKRQLRKIRDDLLQRFDEIPTNTIEVNRGWSRNAKVYEYQVDPNELDELLRGTQTQLDQDLRDILVPDVEDAYRIGTSQTVENLSNMTDDYTRDMNSIVPSEPYQTRVALIRSRVFEEMEGFAGETGRELARVLSSAVQDGKNPREAMKEIRERFSVSESRAERIARTEITNAQRRGRWDEAQSAQVNLGIQTKLMHLSALLPTSRRTHIARHGDLFTVQEVREWYSEDANAINCRCSQVEILVDENGEPKFPNAIERAKKTRDDRRDILPDF